MRATGQFTDRVAGRAGRRSGTDGGAAFAGYWEMVARAPGILKNPKTGLYIPGPIKWEEAFKNLVVNQGLNHILGVEFHGDTQVTAWFIALLKTAPSPTATSTYQNFMGTANQEVTAYDEATRQAFTEGAAASQSISNSGSPAVFTISANGTVIGGAALVSDSTKNHNSAGPFMYNAGAFTAGDKSLDDNDTLTVTVTLTAADDGV